MLKFQIYQSKLKGSSAYGKYYGRIVSDETLGIEELAAHMAKHNTPFSAGTICGILADAVTCTKELLLEGKRISWDNLASFGLGVEHTTGAATANDFSVQQNVKSIRLTAQGIGQFSKSVLTGAASMKESREYLSPKTGDDSDMGGSDTTGKVTLTLSVNDPSMGSVTGAGTYDMGSSTLVKAIPNSGYKFVEWSDGSTFATRTLVFGKDEENVSLMATFAVDDTQSGGSNGNPSGGGGNDGSDDTVYE